MSAHWMHWMHWRWLSVISQANTRMRRIEVNLRWLNLLVLRNVPVDEPTIRFVRKSSYSLRFIVHPSGASAMRIVCDECGADYPFNWTMPSLTPCANCAVPKESGWRLKLGPYKWDWVHTT